MKKSPDTRYVLSAAGGFAKVEGAEPTLETVFERFHCKTKEQKEIAAAHIASQKRFDMFIGIIIAINAVTIGLEVDGSRGDDIEDRLVFFLCEVVFGLIFFSEMILKMHLLGWSYFLDSWNVLDYILVAFSFIDIALSVVFQGTADMKMMSVFRIARMLRLVRNVRLLRLFRELWMLVKGFFATLSMLFWVALLLGMIIYCTGIFLTLLVAGNQTFRELLPYNDMYFGSLSRSMWTVFQVVTADSWANPIVRPLGNLQEGWYFFFCFIIIICSWSVLNVIVGVIVERTLLVALETEAEVQKVVSHCERLIMQELGEFFTKDKLNANGRVDFHTYAETIREPEFRIKVNLIELQTTELEELFYLLDADNTNSISVAEFIHNVPRMKGEAARQDVIQLISYVRRAIRKVESLHARYDHLLKRFDVVYGRLDELWGLTELDVSEHERRHKSMVELREKMREKRKIIHRIEKSRTAWYKVYMRNSVEKSRSRILS